MKLRSTRILIGVFCIGVAALQAAYAQDKIQIVAKTIHKDVVLADGDRLSIDAKKSKITIKGWDNKNLKLELRLLAKHPKKEVAMKEVEYNQYKIEYRKSIYSISNYFYTTDNYSSVKGNLSAEYIIYVPKKMVVDVLNSYGTISLQDIHGEVIIKGKFSPVNLSNVTGSISIDANYSDVNAEKIRGSLTIQSDKSNHSIHQTSGTCFIKSKYGEVLLFPGNGLAKIDVESDKSLVKIYVDDFGDYSYLLTTTYSEIQLPSGFEPQKKGNAIFFEKHNGEKPGIQVSTSFSPIYISRK